MQVWNGCFHRRLTYLWQTKENDSIPTFACHVEGYISWSTRLRTFEKIQFIQPDVFLLFYFHHYVYPIFSYCRISLAGVLFTLSFLSLLPCSSPVFHHFRCLSLFCLYTHASFFLWKIAQSRRKTVHDVVPLVRWSPLEPLNISCDCEVAWTCGAAVHVRTMRPGLVRGPTTCTGGERYPWVRAVRTRLPGVTLDKKQQ